MRRTTNRFDVSATCVGNKGNLNEIEAIQEFREIQVKEIEQMPIKRKFANIRKQFSFRAFLFQL